jgi:hypothetical protein
MTDQSKELLDAPISVIEHVNNVYLKPNNLTIDDLAIGVDYFAGALRRIAKGEHQVLNTDIVVGIHFATGLDLKELIEINKKRYFWAVERNLLGEIKTYTLHTSEPTSMEGVIALNALSAEDKKKAIRNHNTIEKYLNEFITTAKVDNDIKDVIQEKLVAIKVEDCSNKVVLYETIVNIIAALQFQYKISKLGNADLVMFLTNLHSKLK